MVIVAATVVTITPMNINIAVDIYIGVSVNISVAVYVGVPIDVGAIIDIGIPVDICATVNIGPRTTSYLPGLCILGQHPTGSDDKTPDGDQGDKPGG